MAKAGKKKWGEMMREKQYGKLATIILIIVYLTIVFALELRP